MVEIIVTESHHYCPTLWMEMELAAKENVNVIFCQTPEVKSVGHGVLGAASFEGHT